MEVQGVIDLAVHKDGAWYVLDYKTDIPLRGEGREQLVTRLREEYTPQIQAYARVLEHLGQGGVRALYLCSVPLGGTLIPLPLREGDPIPAEPVQWA